VQLLQATREAGRELAESAVDHVVFTGSAAVGRRLAARLGERLVSSSLELSGCDAMFIFPDADLELAARAAWFGATVNRGQTCIAVRRVFVPSSHYSTFLELLRPLAAAAQPVQLVRPEQVREADQLVRQALADGARLLEQPACQAGAGEDKRMFPQVVVDARPEMALCREAVFAPVMTVISYVKLEELLSLDGLCRYGLGASVFSRNAVRAARWAARLRAGMVTINEVIVPTANPATPFLGRRESGWGVTQGAEGLLDMTVPQVISTSTSTFRPHYERAGGAESASAGLVRGLLAWKHAASLRRRWLGFRQILKTLWRGG